MFFTVFHAFFSIFFSLSIPEAHASHNTKRLKPFKVYNSTVLIKNKVPDDQAFKVLTCVIVYMVFRPFFHYVWKITILPLHSSFYAEWLWDMWGRHESSFFSWCSQPVQPLQNYHSNNSNNMLNPYRQGGLRREGICGSIFLAASGTKAMEMLPRASMGSLWLNQGCAWNLTQHANGCWLSRTADSP